MAYFKKLIGINERKCEVVVYDLINEVVYIKKFEKVHAIKQIFKNLGWAYREKKKTLKNRKSGGHMSKLKTRCAQFHHDIRFR